MPLICLASPKGGVGKTMLAANLAQGLQQTGRRVIALDLDPQNALRLHFGVPLGDRSGLFSGPSAVALDWRVAARRTASGVCLIPHGSLDLPGRYGSGLSPERTAGPLAAVLRDILADPGVLLVVDTAAGPSQALATVLPFAEMVILPLLADGGSIATLPDIESGRFLGGGTAGSLLATRLRVVLNQVDPQSRLSATVATALMQRFGPALLGVVGRDEAVAEALACGQPVAAQDPHARAAQDIAGILAVLDVTLAATDPRSGLQTGAASSPWTAAAPPAAASAGAAPWAPAPPATPGPSVLSPARLAEQEPPTSEWPHPPTRAAR